MKDSEVVNLLYRIPRDVLREMSPKGIKVQIAKHDTAIHCSIYLTAENEEDLLVWYKTNWISSAYEFNERNKHIGLQPGCNFIYGQLLAFFEEAKFFLIKQEKLAEEDKKAKDADKSKQRNELIKKYEALYGAEIKKAQTSD